jgi:hypothetical protein
LIPRLTVLVRRGLLIGYFPFLSGGAAGTLVVDLLLDECLYTMPSAEGHAVVGFPPPSASASAPPGAAPGGRDCLAPKCQHSAARSAARELLKQVLRLHLGDGGDGDDGGGEGGAAHASDGGRLLAHVVKRMEALHGSCPAPGSWGENPTHDPGLRNLTGLCGLTNQGSTCYLNSTLQQLYMIPMLRRGLLSVTVPRPLLPAAVDPNTVPQQQPPHEPNSDAMVVAAAAAVARGETEETEGGRALLRSLQRVLHFLDGGMQRFVDPKQLVAACARRLRLAHPVLLQNDAQEFVDQLLGTLEAQLKGTPEENLLRQCFGGVLSHQCFAHRGGGGGGGRRSPAAGEVRSFCLRLQPPPGSEAASSKADKARLVRQVSAGWASAASLAACEEATLCCSHRR